MSGMQAFGLSLSLLLAPIAAAAEIVATATGPIRIDTLATGFDRPWGLAILPDGGMVITEKPGRIRRVNASGSGATLVTGGPATVDDGQGGYLDIAIDPQFVTNGRIYLAFAEAGPGGAGVAVLRARLSGNTLVDQQVIWRVAPKTGSGPQGVEGANHYGSRLAFNKAGQLLVSLGDRFLFAPSQDPGTAIGKIVRITTDGVPAPGNPFLARAGTLPEIYTLGHRNPQGLTVHPSNGSVWSVEHGPSGGDELNIIYAGANYGWPDVSWGNGYDGTDYPDHDTKPRFRLPTRWWTPRIAPSNLAFYRGTAIPAWRGSLLIGSMGENAIVRLSVSGIRITGEERIPIGERVRDVEVDPQGRVFILTDNGNLKRLTLP
jgi:aldose sugar dehydrogenase